MKLRCQVPGDEGHVRKFRTVCLRRLRQVLKDCGSGLPLTRVDRVINDGDENVISAKDASGRESIAANVKIIQTADDPSGDPSKVSVPGVAHYPIILFGMIRRDLAGTSQRTVVARPGVELNSRLRLVR